MHTHCWRELGVGSMYCCKCGVQAPLVAASDRNWAERIEIAKAAREGGRILREGK